MYSRVYMHACILTPLRLFRCIATYIKTCNLQFKPACLLYKIITAAVGIQWNPSITDTFGEQCLKRWPLLRCCFVHKLFIWDHVGCLAVTEVPLYYRIARNFCGPKILRILRMNE